jgi:glycine dehydrogenase subunit 1
MNPYSVPTEEELKQMLEAVGVSSVEDLFDAIPETIRLDDCSQIPAGISEFETLGELRALAEKNMLGLSFLGCGCYDRIIPAAVTHLSTLPTFLTSYTPYQPEVSQGTLQAMFEFQSMICELTGLDVTNASLYDGHTAAAEALMIARNVKRKGSEVLISKAIHPHTLAVIRTHLAGSDMHIRLIPVQNGVTDRDELLSMISDDTVAVLLQSPNIFGYIEDYSTVAEKVHEHKGLLIISSDPISLGLIKTPAEWGADLAIGDLQPFGIPSMFGGPSAGFITAREKLLRKLPGRIVGQSLDVKGQRAFVLTLQAREQHIKRERATSNICSNQAQAALTSAIYMALVGFQGIREVASQSASKAQYLKRGLLGLDGIELYADQPHLGEFTLDFSSAERAKSFLSEMRTSAGIFAGVHLGDLEPETSGLVTVSVTEKRTRTEMDRYIKAAEGVLV